MTTTELPPNIFDSEESDEQLPVQIAKPIKAGERMFRIILEDNPSIPPTGQFISLNGRSWVLRAGEEALVPQSLLGVLDDAITETPIVDGNHDVVGFRKRYRFPYRMLGEQKAT